MNLPYRLARAFSGDRAKAFGHALFWSLFLGGWFVAQFYASLLDEVSR